jgi:acetolactate synthase-1/2/3 large subunit
MQERGIPTIGVDIYTPDLLAIAKGFGCGAERASSLDHLRELLLRAARADRPTVIEVREDADFLKAQGP